MIDLIDMGFIMIRFNYIKVNKYIQKTNQKILKEQSEVSSFEKQSIWSQKVIKKGLLTDKTLQKKTSMKVNLWQYKLAELKNKTKYEMFHYIHKGDTIKREERSKVF